MQSVGAVTNELAIIVAIIYLIIIKVNLIHVEHGQ